MKSFRSGIVDEILSKAPNVFDSKARGSYESSYPEFLKYFQEKSVITKHDFILGANFTYAWMPTILHFKSDDLNKATETLNLAKKGELLSRSDLLSLKSTVNNSLVGSSKLLHFVNPSVYSIWDSRVLKFLSGKGYKYNLEKPELFYTYLRLCQLIAKHESMPKLIEDYNSHVGYKVTGIRFAELIMFHSSHDELEHGWLC